MRMAGAKTPALRFPESANGKSSISRGREFMRAILSNLHAVLQCRGSRAGV
jgi:hypothetical protein